jgi:hypothetical protein
MVKLMPRSNADVRGNGLELGSPALPYIQIRVIPRSSAAYENAMR